MTYAPVPLITALLRPVLFPLVIEIPPMTRPW